MPGTGQSVNPTDVSGTGKTLLLTAVGFGLTAGVASVGVRMWNRASQSTDQFEKIEVL